MTDTLAERLQTPDAYPHPVQTIRLEQTHISWVLLTGDYAYKLKKPVRNAFLDYSDLAKRLRYCHQEVLLNRRFAPQLYLGVVPIGGSRQRPKISAECLPPGTDPPAGTLELAVEMRQFPDDALLSQRLRDGRLTPGQVDEFALQVARFHAAAEALEGTSRWGSPPSIRDDAVANLDHLERSQRLSHLRRWTLETFAELRSVLEQRRSQGWVRACHGDLHLSNVIDWQGRIIPFDGIEFSESLRWIDVISDSAFAAMDFRARQRPDYAHRFVNAYLEASQDYGGLRVLRWYLVYRALVRAKVAAIQAAQPQTDPQEKERQQRKCIALIAQADDYTRPPQPSVLITHGVSGSGKTTASQEVLEQRGAIRLRSDIVRKQGFSADWQSPPAQEIGGGIYSAETTERVYHRLAELAAAVVQAGFPVLVDATFLMRRQRAMFRDLARRLGVPFQLLSCSADVATLQQRLRDRQARGHDASDAGEAVLQHQLATLEPLTEAEKSDLR